jgi:hypothetical protein
MIADLAHVSTRSDVGLAVHRFIDAHVPQADRRPDAVRVVLSTLIEMTRVAREGLRGNTTVKVCHPEGTIKKTYINDREI